MQIKLKSNMAFIFKVFIPLTVVCFIVCVLWAISIAINYNAQKDSLPALIFFSVFTFVLVVILIAIKLYKGRRYEFNESEIACYKREILLDRISVSDIDNIKFGSVLAFFKGPPIEDGLWKLHIYLKDGKKKTFAFFSKKDVKILKEKLYGDLITII